MKCGIPVSAADALFATDNTVAGKLIGQYAKAAMTGKAVKIAMLDEAPGSTVGKLRHNGFLSGYGIADSDPQIVCVGNGGGNQPDSQTAMEHCHDPEELARLLRNDFRAPNVPPMGTAGLGSAGLGMAGQQATRLER